MIISDLWTTKGPTATALKVLERLGQRRRTLEAVTSPDEEEAIVIARALATLDDMEECLCEEGHRAQRLADGWTALDQLEARLADLQEAPPAARRGDATIPFPGTTKPLIQGVPIAVINAIETIRAVARRAVEDPSPRTPTSVPLWGNFGAPAGASRSLLPRLAQLVTRLFAGNATGGAIRIVAQALAAFLPLLDRGRQPAGPREETREEPSAEPELTTKDEARIDVLLQERAARARERCSADINIVKGRARPDRPPEPHAAATTEPAPAVAPPAVAPDDDVWNDLLDLTSEALETFIRFRNAVGVERCLDLLDLLAEAFGIDRPEAA